MGMVIGIDVGISTTKIVGICNGRVVSPMRIKATDPVSSLYGAFGKYLYDNKIQMSDVDHVMLTGVGAAYISKPVYGLPTAKAGEFVADGLGACHESGKDRIIVVSMGTGTSLVRCDGDKIEHIGGIGIGGGTLQGLSRLLLKTDDIRTVSEMAVRGNISSINLRIGDISARPLPGLPMSAVASLFGNARSDASREDIAIGLIWTVLQSVGQSAVLASIGSNIREYVMIGNLTLLPQCRVVFPPIEKLYGVKFIIPEYSEFCTAIGAALCHFDQRFHVEKL
ncbi:type II pantothenate kinase [Marseilla massiliensis]|jgi:type II pantothenate kinase|uniref:Type II pantothenate kinase n=1 Tax=Marseilla massiliensis TaxID=1841864 RepID=A0A938WN82_9BACT|nr:type II pantothenate kinase [Marseilla massiliensis]MBM6661911.1 type II pantothenate kinase [Marseilla massiliensis]MCL1611819.1 type II pantothenate kinase [Marseilla massiliensis]MEE0361574.1 type II pantothenate kinase [Prevotella sp.]